MLFLVLKSADQCCYLVLDWAVNRECKNTSKCKSN